MIAPLDSSPLSTLALTWGRVKVAKQYDLSERLSAALECGGLPPLCFRELARGGGRRRPGQQAGLRESGGKPPNSKAAQSTLTRPLALPYPLLH